MKTRNAATVLVSIVLFSSLIACERGSTPASSSDSQTVNVTSSSVSLAGESSAASSGAEASAIPAADPVVRVFAAGDNLIHSPLYRQAKERSAAGGYNFDYAYQHVAGLVAPADLAILNQETPIANDLFAPSNYPLFNSPTALGDKMIALGFNAVSHSNNHILDKGEKGLLATLDYWSSRNMLVYGAYRNEEDLNTIPTKELNGITFSFVGFMEHTNGLHLPEGSDVRLVYTSDTETMKALIQKADAVSDVVVVSVHWGTEITNTITEQQRRLGRFFADCGADVIIGTQPHTLQSIEVLKSPDGRQSLVAYSLGNFISAQERNLAMIGVTLDFNVSKSLNTGRIDMKDIKAIPVITHYGAGYSDVTVYPYDQYSEELAAAHGVRARGEFGMGYISKIINDNIPAEFLYTNQ